MVWYVIYVLLKLALIAPILPITVLLDVVIIVCSFRLATVTLAFLAGMTFMYMLMLEEEETPLAVPPRLTILFRVITWATGPEPAWLVIYSLHFCERWLLKVITVLRGVIKILHWIEACFVTY